MPKRKYIIRAIDYVNSSPHIGHALEYTQTDVFGRYFRSKGYEVRVGVGTDEHGQKIETSAKEAGIDTQSYCDKYAAHFKTLADRLNVQYDTFIRTSDIKHKRIVQKYWEKVMEKGDLYKKQYEALYCVGCETFKHEKDLEEGKCPHHPHMDPQLVKEENYFFKLSKYQQEIQNWLRDNPQVIFPESRYHEIRNVVQDGLQDISVSRSRKALNWGIPVPKDDEQVMYVWFDALLNYISAIDYGEDEKLFNTWWNNAEILHILGKDIIRHHVAIWPAILLSLGNKLPDKYFVHGFITSGGVKMSKSIGNIINPIELLDEYGTDAVRWYLLKEIPAGKDGDITKEHFGEVYDADLANTLGNLFRRVLMLITKYELDDTDADDFESAIEKYNVQFDTAMEGYNINIACDTILDVLHAANQYIDEKAPWMTVKENQDEAADCLWSLVRLLEWVGEKLKILLPETGKIMLEQIKDLSIGDPLFPKKEE